MSGFKAVAKRNYLLIVKREIGVNIKVAVLEDSSADAEYVTALVDRWGKEAGHTLNINRFPSSEAFLFQYEDEKNVDILLLDIEMGQMNGVDLAKKIRQGNDRVQMIFITGYPDFMAEGYEVSALHYLMKPVSCERLWTVLDRAAANLAREEKRLCVTFERRTDYVFLSRILYIEAQKQYVLIHTLGETYRMKKSLTKTEAELDEYFLQVQRSFCVNLRHVTKIKKGSLMLKNGEEIPISRGMAERISREMIRLF